MKMKKCGNNHRKIQKKFIISFFVVVLLTIIGLFQIHDSYYRKSIELAFYQQEYSNDNSYGNICKLPKYNDPFDPSILSYIKKVSLINCGEPQRSLTYMTKDGYIYFNQSALNDLNEKIKKNMKCSYHEIKRKTNDDSSIDLGPPQILVNGTKLNAEFIIVRCLRGENLQKIYETGHYQIKHKDNKTEEKSKKIRSEGGINVFITVYESMSRLNFMRQLPKTYKTLKDLYKSTTLKGLMKVGDNTYPNMIVMLTGLASSRHNIDKSLGPFFGNASASRGYFDHLPAIWKNFSANNYLTMFAEDCPSISMFNYLAKGFHKPPTTYYMRPFWLAMEKYKSSFKSKDRRCYSHVPKHQYLFSYTEDFVKSMHERGNAYFSFSFLSEISHDDINPIKVLDDDLDSFYTRLYKSGALNNTIIIVMGDHGNRFDPIRKTIIGRVEERMPFFSITIPEKLNYFKKNIEENKNKLTSWHDVYETLMDVAMNNLEPVSKKLRYGHRGLSLFRYIPNNRTCNDVGIPKEYCTCWREKELNPNETRSIDAAITIINHLNKMLITYVDLCSPLELDYVLSAQLLLPSQNVISNPSNFHILIRVTVKVQPSGALFEAMLEKKALSNIILGDVNRINAYGNQSTCVDDKTIKLYCFCTSNML